MKTDEEEMQIKLSKGEEFAKLQHHFIPFALKLASSSSSALRIPRIAIVPPI